MEALTLQKKTALLISAHTLPPSAEHSLTCPRCIFTQPLTCNPKGQGSRVFSISLLTGVLKAPGISPWRLLCPVLPVAPRRLRSDHTRSALVWSHFSSNPPLNLDSSGSSLASTSHSYVQRKKTPLTDKPGTVWTCPGRQPRRPWGRRLSHRLLSFAEQHLASQVLMQCATGRNSPLCRSSRWSFHPILPPLSALRCCD